MREADWIAAQVTRRVFAGERTMVIVFRDRQTWPQPTEMPGRCSRVAGNGGEASCSLRLRWSVTDGIWGTKAGWRQWDSTPAPSSASGLRWRLARTALWVLLPSQPAHRPLWAKGMRRGPLRADGARPTRPYQPPSWRQAWDGDAAAGAERPPALRSRPGISICKE